MILLNKATGQQVRHLNSWQAPTKPAPPTGGTNIDTEARDAIAAVVAALVTAGIFPAN